MWGIVEIVLSLGGEAQVINGNKANGFIQAILEDGSILQAGDVALNYIDVLPPAAVAPPELSLQEAGEI